MHSALKYNQNLWGAIQCMFTVISALFLRETVTLYGQDKLGYLWVLLRDVVGIGAFIVIRYIIGLQFEQGMHIVYFMLSGFVIYYIFAESVSKCMTAISANTSILTFPHVIPLDLMISRCILVFFTNIQAAIVIVLIAFAFDINCVISKLGLLLYCIISIFFLGLGFGILLASLNVFFPFISKIWSFFNRFLFLTCGVFFTINHFPTYLAEILSYNPILQIIEGTREALSNNYVIFHHLNFYYVNFFILTTFSLGLLLENASHRRLEL